MVTGVVRRHSGRCRKRTGGRCDCNAGWEASVWSPRDRKKIRRSFALRAEAVSWRADAKRQIDQGTLRAATRTTLREAAEAWLRGAESGEIRSRSGHRFKPATLRGYRHALDERVVPALGHQKLSTIQTSDLQWLVDRWHAQGWRASTIRNTIKPLQAIYRRAKARHGLPINPTRDLELPTPRPREVEIVAPGVAAKLLAGLPAGEQPVWATALYAGLRYGELRGLRWDAVDTAGGRIEVRESWDPKQGRIDPKTRTSRRAVPIPGALRGLLLDHRLNNREAAGSDLVFGTGEDEPFHAKTLYRRADTAWTDAGITDRLRLHQARHTYASFMIAAGVNAKALSAFMGHSSIKVTFDLYGHLMPGSEREAVALLDTYLVAELERDEARAREAAPAPTG